MKEKDTSPNEGIACRRIVNHRTYFVLVVIVLVEDRSVDNLNNMSSDSFHSVLLGV